MRKGDLRLFVPLMLATLWLQYWFVISFDWVRHRFVYYPTDPIFWPLTITLWVVVVCIGAQILHWRTTEK